MVYINYFKYKYIEAVVHKGRKLADCFGILGDEELIAKLQCGKSFIHTQVITGGFKTQYFP